MIHHSIRREKKKKLIHTQTGGVGERKTMRRMGVKGRAVTRLKAGGKTGKRKIPAISQIRPGAPRVRKYWRMVKETRKPDAAEEEKLGQ